MEWIARSIRILLSPSSWPGWLPYAYKFLDAIGNADFAIGKREVVGEFLNSPLAAFLGLAWLCALVIGLPQRGWASIQRIQKDAATREPSSSNWLEDIAQEDTRNPEHPTFVHHISVLWRLMEKSGAHYLDFQVHAFNGSVYDLVLGTNVEGHIQCDGLELMTKPVVNERGNNNALLVHHATQSYVQLQQDFTNQAPVVQHLRTMVGKAVRIEFGQFQLWAEYRQASGEVVARFPLKLPSHAESPAVFFFG